MQIIAVYGSLKRGFPLHDHYLIASEYLGNSTFLGAMELVGRIPIMWDTGTYPQFETEHAVELYQVRDIVHQAITNIEVAAGYTDCIKRFDLNGESIEAHIYLYPSTIEIYPRGVIDNYSLELLV